MRMIIKISLLLLLFPSYLLSQSQEQPDKLTTDFRDVRWGMTYEEVVEAESALEIEGEFRSDYGELIVGFETTVLQQRVVLAYMVDEQDGLFRSVYVFDEDHSNDNDYIDEYEWIEEILIERYGEPDEVNEEWIDDNYQDRPEKHGFAISLGDYEISSKWRGERTVILHELYGDNYDITHRIEYESLIGSEARNRRRREYAAGDL